MKILVAEDDPVSQLRLVAHLETWRHEPMVTADGSAAWEAMQQKDASPLAILDG